MSGIIGVRRAGDARITFAQTDVVVRIGETVNVDVGDESFTATAIIVTDQFPGTIPMEMVAGIASRINADSVERDGQSIEDERYRSRKRRFPALGDRRPDGIVVRIDMRHESFDVRDDRGQVVATVLPAKPDSPS